MQLAFCGGAHCRMRNLAAAKCENYGSVGCPRRRRSSKIQINHMLGEFGTGFAISGATDFEEPFL